MTRIRFVLVAALVVVLAACSPSPPQPHPAGTEPVPVVTDAQIVGIMVSLQKTLEAADGKLDADAVAQRLEGPALDVRRADYTVAEHDMPLASMPIERDERWTVVSQTTTWPRVVLVVTKQPSDLVGTPRILALRQESPREPYKLWGSAGLGSAMSMPEMTAPHVGSPTLPLNSDKLDMKPGDVLARYTDVLENGDDSRYAGAFVGTDNDGMRRGIEATRKKILDKKGDAGEYSETFTADEEGPVVVLATVDGGALVIGELTTRVEAKGIDVSAAAPEDPMLGRVSALAGGQLGSAMTWTYTGVVVFKIPPAAEPGPVIIMAYSHTVTAAEKL
ncbi:MAG: hypothetical protein FWF02_11980 [Micrococcales bacterium]|nr:hypothetical protein [Micrococcales bacterium]MCL2668403.1 hypothetical protein [Micrococcales bacterium]